jgi:hypothetical protein
MGEYKWQGGAGSKGDGRLGSCGIPPPTPGVQEMVPKSLKIQGIGAIRACAHACNGLKRKGMLGAVGGTEHAGCRRRRESLRGGFSGNQPSETYIKLPPQVIIVKSYFIYNRKEKS